MNEPVVSCTEVVKKMLRRNVHKPRPPRYTVYWTEVADPFGGGVEERRHVDFHHLRQAFRYAINRNKFPPFGRRTSRYEWAQIKDCPWHPLYHELKK